MGANMPHLGSEKYWPIYGEAERLGCAIAIHGGAHEGLLMDDLSPYAPVNALGHPMGQMIAFAGIIFNGIFDKFPGLRIGFMEAGSAWLLTCLERFTGSWESHVQFDPRRRPARGRVRRREPLDAPSRRPDRRGGCPAGGHGGPSWC